MKYLLLGLKMAHLLQSGPAGVTTNHNVNRGSVHVTMNNQNYRVLKPSPTNRYMCSTCRVPDDKKPGLLFLPYQCVLVQIGWLLTVQKVEPYEFYLNIRHGPTR